MKELENEIICLIEKIYHKKYVGKIKVSELENGFQLTLGLNQEEKPLVIAADMSKEDFLSFIEKELHERHLHTTKYYKGVKSYPL
jgi:hypothetical protein